MALSQLIFARVILIFAVASVVSPKKVNAQPMKEAISVEVQIVGGINNRFNFDGNLGDEILGTPEKIPELCEVSARFAHVLVNKKRQLDVRLKFNCVEQEKNRIYRPSRFYLSTDSELPQKKNIGYLSERLPNLALVFENLVLRKSK
jgi:hypothetical protein